MKRPVIGKQPNSRMCFVCGLSNPAGLHASFHELDGGELAAIVTPREEHQGYPGRLHGGIAATILDETIGRAIMIRSRGELWGVTVEFSMRLMKSVPTGKPLRAVARVVKEGSRIYEGSGEILLEDGSVAVEGRGRYIKMPIERITTGGLDGEEWAVVRLPEDPTEVEAGPEPGGPRAREDG
jgi:uncharacterized protein (TIGR00369 family)